MTSLYRVQYPLRAHKRDDFIEFIKGLLGSAFVLVDGEEAADGPEDGHEQNGSDGSNGSNDLKTGSRTVDRSNGSTGQTALERYAGIFASLEHLIDSHRLDPGSAKLARLVPSLGKFFTPLPLKQAFLIQNERRSIAGRRFVPPSFNDVRHILNTAQILAIAPDLKLVSFDGDLTLYEDGGHLKTDSPLVELIGHLLIEHGVNVAVVTAAGYPDAQRYYSRLAPLFQHLTELLSNISLANEPGRMFVMGGESSYLFSFARGPNATDPWDLRPIPASSYLTPEIATWALDQELCDSLLDVGAAALTSTAKRLNLADSVRLIRKQRAVGIVPVNIKASREQLDEFAISAQQAVEKWQASRAHDPEFIRIPYCAFNGGSDVFVDIGNKLIGVQILLRYLGLEGSEALHVGDQFLGTGNDVAARGACATVWVADPEETWKCVEELVGLLRNRRDSGEEQGR